MPGLAARLACFKMPKSGADVDRALRYIVRSAHENVPFYRRRRTTAVIRVDTFQSTADLRLLPVVRKEDLLSRGLLDRMHTYFAPNRCIRRGTSGMTGAPIDVYMSRPELRFRQLNLLFRMRKHCRGMSPMRIVEAGAWVTPARREITVQRTGLATVIHIPRAMDVSKQLGALVASKPTLLTGTPSCLEVLATEIIRRHTRPVRPRVLICRGEILQPQIRCLLGEAFGCRVVDFYNAQEVGNIAWECPTTPGLMHVNHDTCFVEIVDEEGKPVPPGNEGRAIVTSLYSRVMPFIRYDLGDRAKLVSSSAGFCSCGHTGQSMTPPIGRSGDVIRLPDGGRMSIRVVEDLVIESLHISGVDSPYLAGVGAFRIVQESPTVIRIAITSTEDISGIITPRLEQAFRALPCGLHCKIEFTDEFQLGPMGKLRRLVPYADRSSSEAAP